eukprot:756247-Hanusia_phi.AAC.11
MLRAITCRLWAPIRSSTTRSFPICPKSGSSNSKTGFTDLVELVKSDADRREILIRNIHNLQHRVENFSGVDLRNQIISFDALWCYLTLMPTSPELRCKDW